MVKIEIERVTSHGSFRDALLLPEDHGLTDADIEALKDQRVADWSAIVTAPLTDAEVANG